MARAKKAKPAKPAKEIDVVVDPDGQKPFSEVLRAPDGFSLRCSCGCGRIADGREWNSGEPMSTNCFRDGVLQHAAERAAERAARGKRAQNPDAQKEKEAE